MREENALIREIYGNLYSSTLQKGVNINVLTEAGFLQWTTTRDYAIFWHPDGREYVAIKGEGIFKITKI